MKIAIVLLLLGVLAALASAGIFMVRKPRNNDEKGRRMAHALALRVALSIALFLFILLAYHLGWIQPTGIPG